MAGRFRKKGATASAELDVTTFMNLMVVLVPFLLMSAAFSELAIHELNLPTISEASAGPSNDRKQLTLEVIIRNQHLDVIDRNSGRIKLIPNTDKGHDYAALNEKLKEIKAAYPHVTAVTLLLDPDVQYDKLISTMDAVRGYQVKGGGPKAEKRDLFPDVSIGDAPRVEGGAS
jgi:biopolymer transport protein ExbD